MLFLHAKTCIKYHATNHSNIHLHFTFTSSRDTTRNSQMIILGHMVPVFFSWKLPKHGFHAGSTLTERRTYCLGTLSGSGLVGWWDRFFGKPWSSQDWTCRCKWLYKNFRAHSKKSHVIYCPNNSYFGGLARLTNLGSHPVKEAWSFGVSLHQMPSQISTKRALYSHYCSCWVLGAESSKVWIWNMYTVAIWFVSTVALCTWERGCFLFFLKTCRPWPKIQVVGRVQKQTSHASAAPGRESAKYSWLES